MRRLESGNDHPRMLNGDEQDRGERDRDHVRGFERDRDRDPAHLYGRSGEASLSDMRIDDGDRRNRSDFASLKLGRTAVPAPATAAASEARTNVPVAPWAKPVAPSPGNSASGNKQPPPKKAVDDDGWETVVTRK